MSNSGGLITTAELPASVELATSAGVTKLFAAGNSFAATGGASYQDNAWFPKVAKLLGCTRYDTMSQGGALLAISEGDTVGGGARYGGIGRLLQFANNPSPSQTGNIYRTTRPYLTAFQAGLLLWGINDLAWMGPATFAAVYPIALTSAIQRLRAGAVFEDTDASVAYTGASWSNVALTSCNSGTQIKQVTANGDLLTITVPADFPGGTIALRFVTGGVGQGALWTVTGTGSAAGVNTTYDTRNINGFSSGGSRAANGLRLNSVLRLTGLPAGAGTIIATATTVGTAGFFDCWEIEAPQPPLVCLPLQFRCFSYTSAYAAWPYTPTDSDITGTLNTAIAAAAANFDANVFTAATDATLDKSQSYFENNGAGGDNLHPNDLGCGALAPVIVNAIRQASFTQGWNPLSEMLLPDLRFWYPFNGPGVVGFTNSWLDFSLGSDSPAAYHKDFITGRVQLRGRVAKTTGSATDAIVTLPAGCRPGSTIQKPCMVFNGSTWGLGLLAITYAGVVNVNSGGSIAAGSLNDIFTEFPAEQ